MDQKDILSKIKSISEEEIEQLNEIGISIDLEKVKALSSVKKITKELAELAISNKNLKFKTSDNGISHDISMKGQKKESREDYRPTEKQLELINELALEPQTKDSGYVFELVSSSMDMDRSYERMDMKAISDMAKMSPGKPFFLDHNWGTKTTVGRMIKAKNEDGKLVQWVYVPENSKTKETIEELLNGNYNRLSVGFSVNYEDMQCDSCKNSIFDYEACKHWPGMEDEKGNITTVTIKRVKDYYETSVAPVPANPHAGVRKGLPTEPCNSEAGLSKSFSDLDEVFKEAKKESDEALAKFLASASGDIEKNATGTIPLGNNTIQDNTLVEENTKSEEQEQEVVEAPAAEEAAPVVEEPKAEEAPAAVEATEPAKEEEKSQEPGITEVLVKLTETIDALKADVQSLNAKVDLVMTAPTKGLQAIVKAEIQEKKEEDSPAMALLKKFSLNFDQENQ